MSELKVKGKIEKILEVEKGTSKAGKEYQKVNFVINTGDKYNPLICFQIFGEEKVSKFIQYNSIGKEVEVSFNISSREFDGKFYHSIDAWRIDKADGSSTPEPTPIEDNTDEMPF